LGPADIFSKEKVFFLGGKIILQNPSDFKEKPGRTQPFSKLSDPPVGKKNPTPKRPPKKWGKKKTREV